MHVMGIIYFRFLKVGCNIVKRGFSVVEVAQSEICTFLVHFWYTAAFKGGILLDKMLGFISDTHFDTGPVPRRRVTITRRRQSRRVRL